MRQLLTFEDVKLSVESCYPTPVATVFRKCRIANKQDLGGRHKNLIDLFESFVKFLCIVQLQEARQCVANLKERLPQKEKTLEFLKRPSLGGWLSLLRILCNVEYGPSKPRWGNVIAPWYQQPRTPETAEALSLFGEIRDVPFDARSRAPIAEICNALVGYRNKHLAHAANFTDDDLSARLPLLEAVLSHLIRSADFLGGAALFYSNRIEVTPNNEWLIHAARLQGVSAEPAELILARKLDLSELYLTDQIEGRTEARPVPLGPFLLWQQNQDTRGMEAYYYNDAWRTKLEYLSYETGSYYYHKELHSGFQGLIELKVTPGVEEDKHHHLSPEERSDHAESLFKRATAYAAQKRFEDALESLELSLEYERSARSFLEMAGLQRELNDSPDIIRQTLQNCLDIDPSNRQALQLLASLDERPGEPGAEPGEESGEAETVTLLHALSPRQVRAHTFLWWAAVVLGWYALSASVEIMTGSVHNVQQVVLQGASGLLCIALLSFLYGSLVRLRLPLSLQLETMRLERFHPWFDKQMRLVFGRLCFRARRLELARTLRQERPYYVLWTLFFASVALSDFFLRKLYLDSPPLLCKRLLDLVIPFGFLVFPCARALTGTTFFVFRFSELSIKPMLTRINDDGLRSFGPLLTGTHTMVAGIFAVANVMSLSMAKASHEDLVMFGLASIAFLFWSLAMPLALRRAARLARAKAIHAYSQHIENAFHAFLGAPGDDANLLLYEKLLKNQRVIEQLSMWPLSRMETLMLVISNVFVWVVLGWYFAVRLGYVANWADGVFQRMLQ